MSMHDLPPGTILLDRYQILETLGAGGFAVVYKARQASTGQLVAIKILTARGANMEAERFEREMQVLAQLKHPSIVRLIDSGSPNLPRTSTSTFCSRRARESVRISLGFSCRTSTLGFPRTLMVQETWLFNCVRENRIPLNSMSI